MPRGQYDREKARLKRQFNQLQGGPTPFKQAVRRQPKKQTPKVVNHQVAWTEPEVVNHQTSGFSLEDMLHERDILIANLVAIDQQINQRMGEMGIQFINDSTISANQVDFRLHNEQQQED